ncbi:MAG: ATP-binding protein [Thermodesulfovibrionales bacterium]|nr:ATP-binding protein [Thermodesulfovibrionales bacterium]
MDSLIQYLKNLRFHSKIAYSIIAILLFFGIVISIVIGYFTSDAILSEKKSKGISLSVMVASRSVESILSTDFLALKNLVDELVKLNKDISYAFVIDKNNDVLVHTFTQGFPIDLINANKTSGKYNIQLINTGYELIYDIATPVVIGEKIIGTIRIGISHNEAKGVANRQRIIIYLITAIGIIFGALCAVWISRTATQKVKILHNVAKEVIKGNLDIMANKDLKKHCSEYNNCQKIDCPAYYDTNRRCWYIAGTKCPECQDQSFMEKIDKCQRCVVYKLNSGDEIQELMDFFDIMIHTLKDRIETLKKTEQDLQHQKELLKMILDATPDYVTLQDTKMRYVAVNKSFSLLIGKDEIEIIGKTDADILPKNLSEKNKSDNEKILLNGDKITDEFEMSSNGSSRWFHIVRIPIKNTNGEITGILCSSRDITEIKAIHDRLAKAQQLESIGQLAAGVAHEINTPLGIILGYCQLMIEDAQPNTELYDTLLIIEKYTRICKKIVSDLLHFSRHTESKKQSLNVNEIIERVVSVLEHTYSIDRVHFKKKFSSDIKDIYGDSEKLEQVFMNLLRNAFDAIGSDGTITVSTGIDSTENKVIITVTDTGHGIKPENRDKIFNPFFSTKSVGKGTGLGLSVTLGILQDHGGSIDFESPPMTVFPWLSKEDMPEKGTMFIIKLPIYEDNQN